MRAMGVTQTIDMTLGVYRRIYAGYTRGRRINGVSLEAEAWFWRVHAAADDFGNAHGEPSLCHAATAGRRSVTWTQVAGWLNEMSDAGLVRFYQSSGDTYLHIVGFLARQPAGRNGKRIRHFPPSPWDETELSAGSESSGNPGESGGIQTGDDEEKDVKPLSGNSSDSPGESGGIQNNPGAENASHTHTDSHSHSDSQTEADDKLSTKASTATADAATVAAASPTFVTFPTVAGKKTHATHWDLTEDYVSELSDTFTGIDVRAECRKALAWVRAKPGNRKTAGGMREFLVRWMSKANDRGHAHGAYAGRNGKPRVSSLEDWKNRR